MSGFTPVLAGFPNPVGWVVDNVTGFVEGAATAGFEMIIGGLTAWVVDAVMWVVGGVFAFFLDSTDPNVQADWFVAGSGPYATTAAIGATLLVLFVFAGIAQGVLTGDVAGMLRRMALDLPISVLGMVGLVTITQALIGLTDVLSAQVLANFESDIAEFTTVVASLSSLSGPNATAFVVFLLGLVTVLAGMILVAELVIRSALIYIVVALAPLVFATRLWPATQGAARKLLELLCALILSKLVIAVALAVAAAAAVGAGSGGEVTALPQPEHFAEDPGGSVTQAVGILLTAAAAFGVAAFSPLLIARLMPLTEAALVAQGARGGPMRAGHQAMTMANTAQMVGGRRFSQLAAAGAPTSATGASPTPGAKPPAATSGASSSAGAKAGAAAAGPAGAAAAAVGAGAAKAATTGKPTAGSGAGGEQGSSVAQRPAHEPASDRTPRSRRGHPADSALERHRGPVAHPPPARDSRWSGARRDAAADPDRGPVAPPPMDRHSRRLFGEP